MEVGEEGDYYTYPSFVVNRFYIPRCFPADSLRFCGSLPVCKLGRSLIWVIGKRTVITDQIFQRLYSAVQYIYYQLCFKNKNPGNYLQTVYYTNVVFKRSNWKIHCTFPASVWNTCICACVGRCACKIKERHTEGKRTRERERESECVCVCVCVFACVCVSVCV